MDTILDEEPREEKKRPLFLTAVCSISFLRSLFSIALVTYEIITNTNYLNNWYRPPLEIKILMATMALSGILVFSGTFLMFRQKRSGFFIYLMGEGFTIVPPFLVDAYSNAINISPDITFSFYFILLPVLFIILFSLNYKHLR